MFQLNDQDKSLLKKKGISEEKFYNQLKLLEEGVAFISLVQPCTPENGIKTLSDDEIKHYAEFYEQGLNKIKPIKFVPSSGAASRMFSLLSKVLNDYEHYKDKIDGSSEDTEIVSLLEFVNQIVSFAFFDDLKTSIEKNGLNFDNLISDKKYDLILEYLLTEKGLDYLNCPKALIKFHEYDKDARTAFEEHLVEAIKYCKTNDNTARVHFTILQEHENKFTVFIEDELSKYEKEGVKLEITFSFQKPDTEIAAVDLDNNPIRNMNGGLVFRPGGHGVLLQNLGELNNEIIFVKNIDNVVPDRLKIETNMFKRVIGGYLLDIKQTIDRYLKLIDEGKISDSEIENAIKFIEEKLEVKIPSDINSKSNSQNNPKRSELKKEFIFGTLNRPLRVCGVVKNEGQPGGGPFWIKDSQGNVSKQIVESAQVDNKNDKQNGIWNSSTHFNPVDLVCAIYDYKGEKFDLQKYVDMNTVFISKKSKDGINIKAMELPGLWNGAMAYWNTVFIEVPLITFNPVKTVFDLLKPEHLPD
ncbi:MAG: DUF4301 family protein [Candidatus Dadabacteria bacterium]|nr:DUF4301 family protein [Candidatus Dadabacteria bacterium]